MPIKMYDLMWKDLNNILPKMEFNSYARNTSFVYAEQLYTVIHDIEERHTYISQPEAIKMFQTSKKTLANLRVHHGLTFISVGVGSSVHFFYKEGEVRAILNDLRGKE